MGSFVFIVLVLGFIWIVRGLAKAEQRRQQARQAGFTEEEINRIDQKNLAIQTFLAGLIVGPGNIHRNDSSDVLVGLGSLSSRSASHAGPLVLLPEVVTLILPGELTCPHHAPQSLPDTSAWQSKNSNGILLRP